MYYNIDSGRRASGCARFSRPASSEQFRQLRCGYRGGGPQSYYEQAGRGSLARDGGGVLLTQAIHSLDLFRSLVGVTSVEAAQVITTSIHRMETEDYANALVTVG